MKRCFRKKRDDDEEAAVRDVCGGGGGGHDGDGGGTMRRGKGGKGGCSEGVLFNFYVEPRTICRPFWKLLGNFALVFPLHLDHNWKVDHNMLIYSGTSK